MWKFKHDSSCTLRWKFTVLAKMRHLRIFVRKVCANFQFTDETCNCLKGPCKTEKYSTPRLINFSNAPLDISFRNYILVSIKSHCRRSFFFFNNGDLEKVLTSTVSYSRPQLQSCLEYNRPLMWANHVHFSSNNDTKCATLLVLPLHKSSSKIISWRSHKQSP